MVESFSKKKEKKAADSVVCLDVRQVIVELAQVVVVLLIVQSWKDAAAGQLWQILQSEKTK